MNNLNKFNKYLYIVIFSMISVLVFVMEFKAYDTRFIINDNVFVNIFNEFYYSLKQFDIIYVTLWIFILCFYFNVYFDGRKYDNKSKICTIIAIIFAIITLVGKSYDIDNTLATMYKTGVQIFKTIIFAFGYYLIYYAILKKLFDVKCNLKLVKKKHHF